LARSRTKDRAKLRLAHATHDFMVRLSYRSRAHGHRAWRDALECIYQRLTQQQHGEGREPFSIFVDDLELYAYLEAETSQLPGIGDDT
jgi:hypothetical protein